MKIKTSTVIIFCVWLMLVISIFVLGNTAAELQRYKRWYQREVIQNGTALGELPVGPYFTPRN